MTSIHISGSPIRITLIKIIVNSSRAPKEAHSLYHDFISVGNSLAGSINLALTAGIFSSLQLTILTHRTYTSWLDYIGGKRKTSHR